MVPRKDCTVPETIARPMPVPLPTGLVVKNGSKTRAAKAGGMPTPSSLTEMQMYSPGVAVGCCDV